MKVGELKKLIANLPANAEVKVIKENKETVADVKNAKTKTENINGNNYKTLYIEL